MSTSKGIVSGDQVEWDVKGARIRQGHPGQGVTVACVLDVAESRDVIVLLDYFESGREKYYNNLFRCDDVGRVKWAALAPGGFKDAFTLVTWEGGRLRATSWFGYTCLIDPEGGQLQCADFTK